MSVFDIRKRRQEQRAHNQEATDDGYGDAPPDVFDFMNDITDRPLSLSLRSRIAGLTIDPNVGMMYGDIILRPNRLIFPAKTVPRETADALLDILITMDGSLAWMLGDMLIYQEREWGVTYEDIANATNKEVGTLYDYLYVAKQFSGEISDRSEKLSWTHHRVLAAIEDREQRLHWLKLAEQGTETVDKNGIRTRKPWSVAQLRTMLGGGGGKSSFVDRTFNYAQRIETKGPKLSRQDRLDIADEFERVAGRLRNMEGD